MRRALESRGVSRAAAAAIVIVIAVAFVFAAIRERGVS
jgi:hypothetical protein